MSNSQYISPEDIVTPNESHKVNHHMQDIFNPANLPCIKVT